MMIHPTGERLHEFLDGCLAPDEHQAVAAHLDGCPGCRREVELARDIERSARRAVVGTSRGFTDAVMARVMAEASRPATSAPQAPAGLRRFIAPGLLAAIYLTAMLLIGLGNMGDEGGGGSRWASDALVLIDGAIGEGVELFGKMSGSAGGITVVVITAVACLIAIDSLVGRRIPRGRH